MYNFLRNYSDAVVPILCLVFYSVIPHRTKKDWLIFIYASASFIVFGFSDYLADRGINNMPLYHSFSLLEFTLFIFYSFSLFESKKTHAVLLSMSIFYLVYWIINISVWESAKIFNSNSAGIAYLFIMIICGLYFLSLSNRTELLYFQKLPQFWVMTGFLFYCTCSLPVVLSYKYWIFKEIDVHITWTVQIIANIIKFLFLSYGAVCSYKYQRHSLS